MPSTANIETVKDLEQEIKTSDHVLVADYQGLNAEEFTELRNKLREAGVKFKVVKNRLAKIALKNAGINIDEHLKGPSALAYQGKDSTVTTKVLFEFNKKTKKLKVRAGYMFGQVEDAQSLRAIADLPSKEVLLATLAATMNSPLQKLMATLNEPLRSLHAALSAVAKKKEESGAAA